MLCGTPMLIGWGELENEVVCDGRKADGRPDSNDWEEAELLYWIVESV